MKQDISFCPKCGGKLDAGEEDDQFACEECETQFYIQVVAEGDDEADDY